MWESRNRKGKWKNLKTSKIIEGEYLYDWASDSFNILLSKREPITNQRIEFTCTGDSPEWGDWKLIRENE